MELDIYPQAYISYLYGISQTAYFIGDAIGGMISGHLYHISLSWSVTLFSILVAINAIFFFIFL